MDVLTILLIALALAMDAFAVSIAKGIAVKNNRCRTAIILASFFGGFQMLMPVIGLVCGANFERSNSWHRIGLHLGYWVLLAQK